MMETKLNPYISFEDNAREAMQFYEQVFGGTLELHTFKEYNASQDSSEDEKIMHAVLQSGAGITLMGADTPNSMTYSPGSRISISLSGDNIGTLHEYFEKLSIGGTVLMPLMKASWGDSFGMCTDKFGINWMVNITMREPVVSE